MKTFTKLTTTDLLLHAIYKHRKNYDGQMPIKIVMHPALVKQIIPLSPWKAMAPTFLGVPIVPHNLAHHPYLINVKKLVEYI